MAQKRYRIESACPQCGCSFATHLSAEEMKKRYGSVPNIELECGDCMRRYTTAMQEACPEWDQECKMAPKT